MAGIEGECYPSAGTDYADSVTRIAHHNDPLAGVTRLLVDGTNLLHALRRGPERQPPAALIGRLRGAVPPETAIELVFDGPPERGIRGERIAHGVSVRFSGRHTADTILVTLVDDVALAAGAEPGGGSLATDSILVVTDDRDLRFALQRRGARTAGTSWLMTRMERPRLTAPSVGNPRPPVPPRLQQAQSSKARDADAERGGWSPGRGATRKTGNGKRAPKR